MNMMIVFIIQFDFKDKLIQLTKYSINSYISKPNTANLRNWVIEVSIDENKWIEIDRHSDDSKLNKANNTATFNVKEENNEFYRFVRLRQTGYSWCNYPYIPQYHFRLKYIEFFGKLR